MNATKRNNLQQIIQSKLKSLGYTIDIFSPNDRADLIGYDKQGIYIAVKLNDERNIYSESKAGAKFILCTSFEQFTSLLTNKRALSAGLPADLFDD